MKDLTKEAPRSPRTRVGNYVILARAIDKGHADIDGDLGEYHFDCPLDNVLFDFKGVKGPDVRKLLEDGASDEEVAAWLDANGNPKTAAEVTAWSDEMDTVNPYHDPEKKDWFVEQVTPLGLDPATTTLFDWLEADDQASHAN